MQDPIAISSEGKMNTKRHHRALRLTKKMLSKMYAVNDPKDIDDQMRAFERWNDSAMDALDRILDQKEL